MIVDLIVAKIAVAAYLSYKQSQSLGLRSLNFFDLFSVSHASESNEEPAKELEAPSSTAKQLETPQTKPCDAVLEDRIVQAVFDKLRQNKEPQIIINFFGGKHIVAPNAQEAYQQFHSSSQPKKD